VSGIALHNAWFSYEQYAVLKSATLVLKTGESVVVAGANASGKSTLLYVCAGLLQLERGSLQLGGFAVDGLHPGELFRRGVRCGVVFQEGGLLSNMNALANVALALNYHADALGLSTDEVEERARLALERVRIPEAQHYTLPAHLSFGVRKRLALARAIAIEPNFFFFDDPDVGLDPSTAALVHEILCQYRDDPKVTMVVATNRELLIERLKVRGMYLRNGQVLDQSEGANSVRSQ
jgi:phospholipid/cholesterol/gamma-HCH transport system ATP-binding protein